MSARRYILAAAMSASAGLLSFTDASYAAAPIAESASPPPMNGVTPSNGRSVVARRYRTWSATDYQFYYNTPGYFPGSTRGLDFAPELGPSLGSGFSENGYASVAAVADRRHALKCNRHDEYKTSFFEQY